MSAARLPALIAALLALAALALAAAPASAQEPSASLSEIEREVMCPVCGVPLELAHEAAQAKQQRRMIQGLIDRGYTKEEIKDELVAEFGPDVLAVPASSGFELTAWVVPIAAFVAASGAILIGLRRWRRSTLESAGEGGASEEPLDPEAAKRLERDIGRYEL